MPDIFVFYMVCSIKTVRVPEGKSQNEAALLALFIEWITSPPFVLRLYLKLPLTSLVANGPFGKEREISYRFPRAC